MSYKQIKLLGLLTVASIILTGCTLFQLNKGADTSKEAGQFSTTEKVSGSFMDLLSIGKSLKCTYSGTMETGKYEGTTFVSGNKMRGDMSTKVMIAGSETEMRNHTIGDGEWIYMWNEGSQTGTKMKVEEAQESSTPEGKEPSPEQKRIADQVKEKVNYDCDSWIPDNSLFEVPRDINFVSFEETMKNLIPDTSGENGSACGVCDSLPDGEAKTMCKENLGCE